MKTTSVPAYKVNPVFLHNLGPGDLIVLAPEIGKPNAEIWICGRTEHRAGWPDLANDKVALKSLRNGRVIALPVMTSVARVQLVETIYQFPDAVLDPAAGEILQPVAKANEPG